MTRFHRPRPECVVLTDAASVLCSRCVIEDRALGRMRGLLGRRELPVGEGLLLHPAPSIHTWGMRFAIDVVFLDWEMRVLKVAERLPPWRIASHRHARTVLELAAGEVARNGVAVGERLRFEDHRPAEERAVAANAVVLAARDRRFLGVTQFLLARSGYTVHATRDPERVLELAQRHGATAAVVDASGGVGSAVRAIAAAEAMRPQLRVVLVADEDDITRLGRNGVVKKWAPFSELERELARAIVDEPPSLVAYGSA